MHRQIIFVCALIAVVLSGCATSDAVAPNIPPASPYRSSQSPIALWGVWRIEIDPLTCEPVIVPLRGAEFIANVTMFLQPPAGKLTNLILKNIEVDLTGTPGFIGVECDVGLTHPFPGLDRYTGFDVRGVFMHDGDLVSSEDSAITYAGDGSARLLNADGYTRWMNASEFTTKGILGYTPGALGSKGFVPDATLNPYKYFCGGLEKDTEMSAFFHEPANVDNRGYFRPGSTNYRHYSLLWPEGPITFQYAAIASYDEPNPNPPQDVPDDFPITANCPEAFLIAVADNGSTAFYEDPDSKGGDLHLALEVFDWGALGHGLGVIGEIESITFESPGPLIPSPATFDPSELPAQDGTAVSSVYMVDIPGVQPSALTGQKVLCRVTSAIHTTYDFGLGGDYPDDAVLASYVVFDAPILPTGGGLPVAVAATCDCLWIAPGESITFDGSKSYSPNGPIVSWEWDFDGDGIYGDPHSGPDDKPVATFANQGTYTVDLKVTDNLGKTDSLDSSEKLQVHVGSWTSPPTAVSEICPTIGFTGFAGDFEGSGSLGTIDLYEWDFEGDCIWDYQHPTIGDTTHAYDDPGIFNAILRVTQQGCDTSSTEVRMIEPLDVIENGNFWDGTFNLWEHGHWTKPGPPVEEIIPDPTFKNIVRFYVPPTSDGNCTWIMQFLDYDVSDLDSFYFNFFFYVDYNTLTGDGWLAGDPDFVVRICYEDENGKWNGTNLYEAWYGYDTSSDGTWQWDYPQPPPWTMPEWVTYHEMEQVPEDTWLERKTENLMEIDPNKPVTIKEIWVTCRGWSWQSYTILPWFSLE